MGTQITVFDSMFVFGSMLPCSRLDVLSCSRKQHVLVFVFAGKKHVFVVFGTMFAAPRLRHFLPKASNMKQKEMLQLVSNKTNIYIYIY